MNRRLAQSNLDLIAISRSRSSRLLKRAFCRQKKTRAPQRKRRRRRKRRTVGISTLVASANSACNSSTVVDHGMLPTYKRLAGGEAGCCCSDIFFLSFFFRFFGNFFVRNFVLFFIDDVGRRRKNNKHESKKNKSDSLLTTHLGSPYILFESLNTSLSVFIKSLFCPSKNHQKRSRTKILMLRVLLESVVATGTFLGLYGAADAVRFAFFLPLSSLLFLLSLCFFSLV